MGVEDARPETGTAARGGELERNEVVDAAPGSLTDVTCELPACSLTMSRVIVRPRPVPSRLCR